MNIAPTTPVKRALCAAIAAGLFISGVMLVGQWGASLVAVAIGAALAGMGVTWLGAEAHSLLRQAVKTKSGRL
jgi:hypothetical protein